MCGYPLFHEKQISRLHSYIEAQQLYLFCICIHGHCLHRANFVYDRKASTLTCLDYKYEKHDRFPYWHLTCQKQNFLYKPSQPCRSSGDQRRFANIKAKFFCELRDKILEGRIAAILNMDHDLDKVLYRIDKYGRYHISSNNAPVAELIALAATVIP